MIAKNIKSLHVYYSCFFAVYEWRFRWKWLRLSLPLYIVAMKLVCMCVCQPRSMCRKSMSAAAGESVCVRARVCLWPLLRFWFKLLFLLFVFNPLFRHRLHRHHHHHFIRNFTLQLHAYKLTQPYTNTHAHN